MDRSIVREEALVREAKALGLDREDELIRRRLVQKMEFLTSGLIDETIDVSDAALEAFLNERVDDYRAPSCLLLRTYLSVQSTGPIRPKNARVFLQSN